MTKKNDSESTVREIRRKTRKKYSPEEKIRIVLEGLRGEDSIAELCRREGIHANLYIQMEQGVSGSGQAESSGRHQTSGLDS